MDKTTPSKETGLKTAWNNPWFSVPSLVFFAFGLFLLLDLKHGEEILFFNQWRFEPLNTFFRGATHLGEAPGFIVCTIGALFVRYRYALLIAFAGLITIPISYQLKDTIGEDRPITYFENIGKRDYLVLVPGERVNGGQTSFPSGHTTAAFNLFSLLTALFYKKPKLGLLFATTAIAVGFSRIFLAQHFLPDVLAGALLGLGISRLSIALFNKFMPVKRFEGLEANLLSV